MDLRLLEGLLILICLYLLSPVLRKRGSFRKCEQNVCDVNKYTVYVKNVKLMLCLSVMI